MATEDEFWLARIAAIEAQIVALETAVISLSSGAVESYTFDDGQTRQTVTRSSMAAMQNKISALLSQRDVYRARLGIGTPVYGRPGF